MLSVRTVMSLLVVLALPGCGRFGFEAHELGPIDASADAGLDLAMPQDLGDLGARDASIPTDATDASPQPSQPQVVLGAEAGLVTTEAGGADTFSVVLATAPTADVFFAMSSSDPSEGVASPGFVTFTSSNWDTPQTITVTGVDDTFADGDAAYTIVTTGTTSADAAYAGLEVTDVAVTNEDDDTVGILATATAALTTSEDGTSVAVSVALRSAPAASVTLGVASDDATEGTVSADTLTFSATNWNVPRVITVTGADDFIADGSVAYELVIRVGATDDTRYATVADVHLAFTNDDNDVPGITVSPTSGLITTEGGGIANFEVALSSQPASDVTLDLNSTNVLEGTVSPASLTFTSLNWGAAQTINVTGVNDVLNDGNIPYTILTSNLASADPSYNGLAVDDVDLINIDDDTPGVTITPTLGLRTTEAGGTASFSLVLTVPPAADVTVALASSNLGEGTINPSTVTFTPANWSTPQSALATGVNDFVMDGDVLYTIVTSPASSADAAYNGRGVADVSVTNQNVITYVKASNTGAGDAFAGAIAMSADGSTIVVGAREEASSARGVGGNQADNSVPASGAIYVFVRAGAGWTQQAYIKSSNSDFDHRFGETVTISADGNTIAAGARSESSSATGVGGDGSDRSAPSAGAAYVFTRTGSTWTQQAYIKASNTGFNDGFGSVALSPDGNTLAVGARGEASASAGVGANQFDDSLYLSGAAYVFVRAASVWTQQVYIKATNPGGADYFGDNLALSADGNTLAVAAWGESSAARGIGGDQADNSAPQSGAVYVFTRVGVVWTQQAYVKSSNGEVSDLFGISLALSADGNTLAVGASSEASDTIGVGGDQSDNSAPYSGAVYTFTRAAGVWTQQAYIKASNTDANDAFGLRVALSSDGTVLAVTAPGESSRANGIGGNQTDNSAIRSGAAYILRYAGSAWTHRVYVKASTEQPNDTFGIGLALSGDGNTLVVGTPEEDGGSTGVGGNQADNSALRSGAFYVYE